MALRGALLQTHPCRIIVSDQGSEDLSREVVLHVLKDYSGIHTVELKICPEIKNRGHTGYNDHYNWFQKTFKYDICLSCSADDLSHPDRVEKTVKAYEENNMPSMVLTKQLFCDPGPDHTLVAIGQSCYPEESRFLNGTEIIKELVGGSSTQSWSYEFAEEIGPLSVSCLPDVYMPFLASQSKKGCYYLNEAVHSFIRWVDANNMGASGVMAAATTEEEKARISEVSLYQLTNAYVRCAEKSEELYPEGKDSQACYEKIVTHAAQWANQRNDMTMHRIQPKGATI